jgi:hypothetical protein
VGEYHIGLAADKNLLATDLDVKNVLFLLQVLYGITHSNQEKRKGGYVRRYSLIRQQK